MAAKKRKSKSRSKNSIKSSVSDSFKKIFLSSQGLPIMLTLSVLGVLFVLFRMKGIELNYKITNMNKDIEKVALESKELKAKKARLLSVKNLRTIAKKYELKQPKQNQVIVIP
ncbi:hypothetical protein BIY24_00310 [Halobacteriovorax marinus]|uniref:Membrane protein n=1 Tax=Halobacteriovorax marinus (strain ATCC BAA-682 / DSM 15412 / SJ) TaxID=862908 RepID=E1X243_HALMS|nr:hypothetical protein [Halobacteriovorax marinus]ATH06435.1 hypothetical protein BIY24_00310 [Halobacteriovorax marinus]CBW24999.1 putative membrane protein [Halobacteriovorax marinus SJ]